MNGFPCLASHEEWASWIWCRVEEEESARYGNLSTEKAMELSAHRKGFGAGSGRWHTLEGTSGNGSNGSASARIRYGLNLEREYKFCGFLCW